MQTRIAGLAIRHACITNARGPVELIWRAPCAPNVFELVRLAREQTCPSGAFGVFSRAGELERAPAEGLRTCRGVELLREQNVLIWTGY